MDLWWDIGILKEGGALCAARSRYPERSDECEFILTDARGDVVGSRRT